MAISNYTNLSELMNGMLKEGLGVSISDLADEAGRRRLILASEGEMADRGDLENGFIALVEAHYRAHAIEPAIADEAESRLLGLYESGKLAENGYGGADGDRFLQIKWKAVAGNLPVISNL